jgi:hypothetical protein
MTQKEIKLTKHNYYFDAYSKYSPDELIKIANRMKEDNVSSFSICDDYGSIGFEYFRLETESETSDRLKKEIIENEQRIKSREEYIKREALALGYKIEKV